MRLLNKELGNFLGSDAVTGHENCKPNNFHAF